MKELFAITKEPFLLTVPSHAARTRPLTDAACHPIWQKDGRKQVPRAACLPRQQGVPGVSASTVPSLR